MGIRSSGSWQWAIGSRVRNFTLVLTAAMAFVVLPGCKAGKTQDQLDQIDVKLTQLESYKAIAENAVAVIKPVLALLPASAQPQANAAVEKAEAFLASYPELKTQYQAVRDDLAQVLAEKQADDDVTLEVVGSVIGGIGSLFGAGWVGNVIGLFRGAKKTAKVVAAGRKADSAFNSTFNNDTTLAATAMKNVSDNMPAVITKAIRAANDDIGV